MATQFSAVYEGGLLRPMVPINLPEGARVEVTVVGAAEEPSANPADILRAIAAMPEREGPSFTGREHDMVLYGRQDKP